MRFFLRELKRRNVHRAAAFYAAAAWLFVQIATQVFPFYHVSNWAVRLVIAAVLVGFPFAMLFSWFYEWTPGGLKRESEIDDDPTIARGTGKRFDRWIIAILAAAVVLLLADLLVLRKPANTASAQRAVADAPANSIAVLPFVDMSAGKDQEYMSDGLSEELLNLLAEIPALRVIARSSSFSFKGKNLEIGEIARRLNVAHILEGSVRKAGNKLRIATQLIDARTDTEVWSETYDRDLTDIFAVQDEIAGAVVAQLKLTLLAPLPKVQRTDPHAYALYLQAVQVRRMRKPDSDEQSIALLKQALSIDPNYAAGWTSLAFDYINSSRPIDGASRLAREAAAKALAIDPDYAPVYSALGSIATLYDGDLVAAAAYYKRGLELEPANPYMIASASVMFQQMGRLDQAIRLRKFAVARDPANPFPHLNLGIDFYYAGRSDDAIAAFRASLAITPDGVLAHYLIGQALLQKGDAAAALAEIQQEPSATWRMVGLPLVYHALGRKKEADAALAALISSGNDQAFNIARVLAARGDTDRAYEWLDKAITNHDTLATILVEPDLASLHADPRWLPLLRRVGKAPEQLAAITFDVTLPQDTIASSGTLR